MKSSARHDQTNLDGVPEARPGARCAVQELARCCDGDGPSTARVAERIGMQAYDVLCLLVAPCGRSLQALSSKHAN
jgi:hypothetical protein